MFEDRADTAEADEDGGGRNGKYEIKALRKTVGTVAEMIICGLEKTEGRVV